MKTIEATMSTIDLENNHRKINTPEEIEILKAASSVNLLNDVIAGQSDPDIQTSPLINDLKSKINIPDQAKNKILKTNNYNNQ
jgi:hypothetical protein